MLNREVLHLGRFRWFSVFDLGLIVGGACRCVVSNCGQAGGSQFCSADVELLWFEFST